VITFSRNAVLPSCYTTWKCLYSPHCIIWSVDSQEIINIVATKCQILRLKFTKFDFGWGSAPDTAGRACSAPPDPIDGFKGTYFYVKRREGKERGGEGKTGKEELSSNTYF